MEVLAFSPKVLAFPPEVLAFLPKVLAFLTKVLAFSLSFQFRFWCTATTSADGGRLGV